MITQCIRYFLCGIIFSNCCCTVKQQYRSVLVPMNLYEQQFITKTLLDSIKHRNDFKNTHLSVSTYKNTESAVFKGDTSTIAPIVVAVSSDQNLSFVEKSLIMPLDSLFNRGWLQEFRKNSIFFEFAGFDKKSYFVPVSSQCKVMVYVKSKVADACVTWKEYRNDISSELKKYNSFGLPLGYALEQDPELWDLFDLFVAGWVWSHTIYNGKQEPKIVHPNQLTDDCAEMLMNKVLSCGSDSIGLLTGNTTALIDALEWEALFFTSNIYTLADSLKGEYRNQILDAFLQERVFCAFLNQAESLRLKNLVSAQNKRGAIILEDIGVCPLVSGCSVALTKKGEIIRVGSKRGVTTLSCWAIPLSTPDLKQSCVLVEYLTQFDSQLNESTNIGKIPVRKDILGEIQLFFGNTWTDKLYLYSLKQLMYNSSFPLSIVRYHPELIAVYKAVWNDIIYKKNWSKEKETHDRKYIQAQVTTSSGGILKPPPE